MVLVSPTDISALGLVDRQMVDVISEFDTPAGTEYRRDQLPGRRLPHRPGLRGRLVPGGECAGADQLGRRRIGHPDVEGLIIRLEPASARIGPDDGGAASQHGGLH